MKIFRIILTTLGAFLIVGGLFSWYIGFFKTIKIKEKEAGDYRIIGLKTTGSYSVTGKSMLNVEEILKKFGISSKKEFGIYYDNPEVTPAKNCRSYVGAILEEKDFDRVSELVSAGLEVDTVEKTKTVIAEFPLRNALSYMVGAMKVYPLLSKYMKEKNYTCKLTMEIYDLQNKKIIYMMHY